MQIFSCTVAMSFCLAMYLVTMYPDLAGGDAGELSAAAILGGVPHPPGYPLYAMLGRGFVHLFPFGGSPARQLNLLACFCGAGAASILHWSVLRRTQHAGDASYLAAWTGSLKHLCFSPCEMWILSKFWLKNCFRFSFSYSLNAPDTLDRCSHGAFCVLSSGLGIFYPGRRFRPFEVRPVSPNNC